jgi:hypothetical protein
VIISVLPWLFLINQFTAFPRLFIYKKISRLDFQSLKNVGSAPLRVPHNRKHHKVLSYSSVLTEEMLNGVSNSSLSERMVLQSSLGSYPLSESLKPQRSPNSGQPSKSISTTSSLLMSFIWEDRR